MFRWLFMACMAATSGHAAGNMINLSHACPSEFTKLGDYCYKSINGLVKSWHDANNYCKENGAFLTNVQNMKEQYIILETLRKFVSCTDDYKFYWIGYAKNASGALINAADVGLLTNPTNCEAIWGFNGKRNWFPCNNMDSEVRGWICKENIE